MRSTMGRTICVSMNQRRVERATCLDLPLGSAYRRVIVAIERDWQVLGCAHSETGTKIGASFGELAHRNLRFSLRPTAFFFACCRAHVDFLDIALEPHIILLLMRVIRLTLPNGLTVVGCSTEGRERLVWIKRTEPRNL